MSDRCSGGRAEDRSGAAVEALLRERLGVERIERACVGDERDQIAEQVRDWAGAGVDLIVTTGGTGLGPRDVTPEAVRSVIEREAPGLMELARSGSAASTPLAYLSRGVAGVVGRTLVIAVPGSLRGATEQLGALLGVLDHAIRIARGEDAHGAEAGGESGVIGS